MNTEPTKHMKENNTEQKDKPFFIPEPPWWLGMSLAALLGGIFVAAIIVLYHLTH